MYSYRISEENECPLNSPQFINMSWQRNTLLKDPPAYRRPSLNTVALHHHHTYESNVLPDTVPRSSPIKHQPYLDHSRHPLDLNGVFADSSLLTSTDNNQIILEHHQRLHEEHVGYSSTHSSPRSSRDSSSCGQESTSSRRLRLETPDQRQERLRKNAERGKLRRTMETESQRLRRLKKNAERGKLRRREESVDKRQERLRKNAERQKARRNMETTEERKLRLQLNAERQRVRRKGGVVAVSRSDNNRSHRRTINELGEIVKVEFDEFVPESDHFLYQEESVD